MSVDPCTLKSSQKFPLIAATRPIEAKTIMMTPTTIPTMGTAGAETLVMAIATWCMLS